MRISKVFNSIVMSNYGKIKNPYVGGYQRKVFYNRKTERGFKKMYYYGAALWDMRKQNEGTMYFITISPPQHDKEVFYSVKKTGEVKVQYGSQFYSSSRYTDQQSYKKLKAWLRNKEFAYICAAERQVQTGNLHYHLLVNCRAKLYSGSEDKGKHCLSEVGKLAKLFQVREHASLYDVKEISDFNGVVSYCTKGYGNHNRKKGTSYSSLFMSRTMSVSASVLSFYKENAHNYERSLTYQNFNSQADFYEFVWPHLKEKMLETPNKFFKIYDFNETIFEAAKPANLQGIIKTDFKIIN